MPKLKRRKDVTKKATERIKLIKWQTDLTVNFLKHFEWVLSNNN